MPAARTLAEIRTTCKPKPLVDGELDTFFVTTDDARDEKSHLRQRLQAIFNEGDEPKRVLVYGHRGCGKSTELNRFKEEAGDQWWIVDFSIKNYLPPVGVRAEDILLAIAVAVFDKAGDGVDGAPLAIGDGLLGGVRDFFAEVTQSQVASTDAKLAASAEVGVGGGLWASLLALKVKLSSELAYGSRSEDSIIRKVHRRPGDLITAVNTLLLAVEGALAPMGRRLLVVVEDLDKLQLVEANEVFVRNNLLLAKLATNVIFTIPIFTFYTPDADAIYSQFDAHLHFQMLKVVELDGSVAAGYAKIEEIILKRIDPSLIDPDALDLLIRGTGGVLRHVFEALQSISSFANIRDNHIRRQNVRDALTKIRTELGTQIGWPRRPDGTQDKPEELYEKLAEIARVQAAGDIFPPMNDPAIQVLLSSCSLIEYNGQRWLGVHPMAREFLTLIKKYVGPDPYGID